MEKFKNKSWLGNDNANNFKQKIEDIMKIVKSFEDSGLLIKLVSKTNKTEAK